MNFQQWHLAEALLIMLLLAIHSDPLMSSYESHRKIKTPQSKYSYKRRQIFRFMHN